MINSPEDAKAFQKFPGNRKWDGGMGVKNQIVMFFSPGRDLCCVNVCGRQINSLALLSSGREAVQDVSCRSAGRQEIRMSVYRDFRFHLLGRYKPVAPRWRTEPVVSKLRQLSALAGEFPVRPIFPYIPGVTVRVLSDKCCMRNGGGGVTG